MALFSLLGFLALSASTAALAPYRPRDALINHETPHLDARDIVATPRFGLVMDTSGSMGDYIAALRSEIKTILQNRVGTPDQPSPLVLSPFNDGDAGAGSASSSPNLAGFGAALDALQAEGGGDCPELALTGITKALDKLPAGGHLFVVTDASAKDASLVSDVISLARGKRIKVFFFLFDTICGTGEPAYTSIAHATGGQTHTGLTVADASLVPALIDAVVRSLSIELVHVLPDDALPIADLTQTPLGRRAEVSAATLSKRYVSEVRFAVDASLTSLTFSIDSGRSVAVKRPDGTVVGATDANAKIIVLTRGVVVAVAAPQSGTWTVTVSDCDECSINVFGQSPVQFTFGLSQPTESGFIDVTEAPAIGCTYRAVAEIDGTISNPTFELRRANGDLLGPLPMSQGTGALSGSYVGELAVPDVSGFTVYLRGTDGNGGEIVRVIAGIIRGVPGGTCPGSGTPQPSTTTTAPGEQPSETEPPISTTAPGEEPTETERPSSTNPPEEEPTETEPPIPTTAPEEEPIESEPPAPSMEPDPSTTRARTVSNDGITRPSVTTSRSRSQDVTGAAPATTDVGGPIATSGTGSIIASAPQPTTTARGVQAPIACPGLHPVCGGLTAYYPAGQYRVTTVIVYWTTLCPTIARITTGTGVLLQTRLATITSTLTVHSAIPCGACAGHNHPQRPPPPPPPALPPCNGTPNCPHGPSSPPTCHGPHCPEPEPPRCPGPECKGQEGPACPGPQCPHQQPPACVGPHCAGAERRPDCGGCATSGSCPPGCPTHPPPLGTGVDPGTPLVMTPPFVTGGAAANRALERVLTAQVYVVVMGVLLL